MLALEHQGLAVWVFGLSAGAAAAGVAVSAAFDDRLGAWALALVLAGVGGVTGLALMAPQRGTWPLAASFPRSAASHLGLPVGQVEAFEGMALADGMRYPDGFTSIAVRLRRVGGPQGEAQASGRVQVRAAGALRVYRGQELSVRGRLRPTSTPGAEAFFSRVAAADVTAGPIPGGLWRRRAAWLAGLERGLERLDPQVAALLSALLLGMRGEVDPQLYERFRASGALHLLALSGLHVGIVFALLWGLLPFLRPRALRRFAAVAGVLFYLFLVGVRPSLLRAVVMLAAAAVGAALDREAVPLNLLALAAILVLLLDPWRYSDLGCQLSFLSLAGVCLLSPALSRWLRRWLPRWLAAALAVSAGAQAGSAPLLLQRFGAVQPIGAIAAVVLIPMVTLYLWAGLAALPFTLIGGPVLTAADWLLRGLHRLLRVCLEAFARFPPLRLPWPAWLWAPLVLLFALAALGPPLRAALPAADRAGGAA